MKYKVIVLCGKAGSGKDTIQKRVCEDSRTHKVISCTSRPMRDREQNGVDYHFLNSDDFAEQLLKDNHFIEATVFKDWCYGTRYQDLDPDKINVAILNPEGVSILLDNPDLDVTIFYITATDKNRLIRQLEREAAPDIKEIIRRYEADEQDFWDIYEELSPIVLNNDTLKDLDNCVNFILGNLD